MAHSFEIEKEFMLDGAPIKLISGAIHYFRVVPEYWQDRLEKLRAMGCNTVETYVPWNLHEPQKGNFDFSGMLDLVAFLKLAQKLGLWAIVRPSPYICAEWELGGLPAWLLAEDGMRLRCTYAPYLRHVKAYYSVLLPQLAPLQVTQGGNVILMQVENEYGAYGDETAYLAYLRDLLRQEGITVPLVTSDGPWSDFLQNGGVEGVHKTANFGSKAKEQFAILEKQVPSGPLMCMEFWVGWFDAWGDASHHTTSPEDCAKEFDTLLSRGSANIYMFHGGTNFGFTNGANDYGKLLPDVTSYDYDAPVSECGDLTPKYMAMREVAGKYTELPPLVFSQVIPKCAYGSFPVCEKVSLFETIDAMAKLTLSPWPLSMEKLGQNFGYTLYRTERKQASPIQRLRLMNTNDRAQVFFDGEKVLTLYDRELLSDQELAYDAPVEYLDILTENMGRVNYGPAMETQHKGIVGPVVLNGHGHSGWEMYGITMEKEQLALLDFTGEWREEHPSFYRVPFTVDTLGDTFLELTDWGKGCVSLNGFVLGRFWEKGPQKRLYIPAPLLRQGENELIIFETEGKCSGTVCFCDTPAL